MAHETETLAGYVADLQFEDIPHEVRQRAKVLTLDFLGSAIRARRDAESTPSLLKMLQALELDGGGKSVRVFIHMSDVADATSKIARSGPQGMQRQQVEQGSKSELLAETNGHNTTSELLLVFGINLRFSATSDTSLVELPQISLGTRY